jgi:hypothetical protein
MAVHLAVGGDRGGLVFPLPTGGEPAGGRAKGADRLGRCAGQRMRQALNVQIPKLGDVASNRRPFCAIDHIGLPGLSTAKVAPSTCPEALTAPPIDRSALSTSSL